jgi:hypothetical protein
VESNWRSFALLYGLDAFPFSIFQPEQVRASQLIGNPSFVLTNIELSPSEVLGFPISLPSTGVPGFPGVGVPVDLSLGFPYGFSVFPD